MTAKEIIQVIKACRSSGVSKLSVEGMEIELHPRDGAKPKADPDDTTPPPSDRELKEVEQEVNLVAQAEQAEDELDHMRVENPALFEQLLVEREFEERVGQDGEESND